MARTKSVKVPLAEIGGQRERRLPTSLDATREPDELRQRHKGDELLRQIFEYLQGRELPDEMKPKRPKRKRVPDEQRLDEDERLRRLMKELPADGRFREIEE